MIAISEVMCECMKTGKYRAGNQRYYRDDVEFGPSYYARSFGLNNDLTSRCCAPVVSPAMVRAAASVDRTVS